MEFDTLVDIFGLDVLSNVQFRNDPLVKQFLDFKQNELIMKSSVGAQYILKRIADPAYTVDILSQMSIKIHDAAPNSIQYQNMLTNLIRFSSLQMILPEKGRAGSVISYYESIKNLRFCKTNPLFWLQYAIACLVIDDLPRSKRYFLDAYSYAKKTNFNPFQIDNHYARFLLVEAIELLDIKPAMENFRKARLIINRQINVERLRYPYRVASEYQRFFDRFSSNFSQDQIREVNQAAVDVKAAIDRLYPGRSKQRYIVDCLEAMEYIIAKSAKLIVN